jgi:Pilin accessory protein (PilO)
MKAIRIGPNMVIVGLDWMTSQAVTPKEAIEEVLSQDKSKPYGCVVEGVDTIAVGLSEKSEKGNVGAAWLADSQKEDGDVVLVESIGGGDYWLCAIKNGAPFYGSDLVGDFDHIEKEARSILETGGFTLMSSDQAMLDALKDIAPNQIQEGFSAAAKGKGTYKLKSLKLQRKAVMYALAGVVLFCFLAGAVMYGLEWMNDSQLAAKAQQKKKQAAAALAQQIEAAKADFEIAKTTLVTEKTREVEGLLTNQSGRNATSQWAKALGSLRLDTAGWAYSEAACDTKECVLQLRPTDGATNKDLFTLFPGASLDAKGFAEIKLSVSWQPQPTKMSDLRTSSQFTIDGISEFQILQGMGFKTDWKDAEEVSVDLPIPPVLQNVAAGAVAGQPGISAQPLAVGMPKVMEKVGLGISKGTFAVSGTQLWSMDGVSQHLTGKEVVYDKLKVSFEPGAGSIGSVKSWIIEGSFYAKPK